MDELEKMSQSKVFLSMIMKKKNVFNSWAR